MHVLSVLTPGMHFVQLSNIALEARTDVLNVVGFASHFEFDSLQMMLFRVRFSVWFSR